ncbi:MAG TPA: hypothetical protein VIK38_01735 [Coriobacteriia bacterium]|jgi:hypothetical protein
MAPTWQRSMQVPQGAPAAAQSGLADQQRRDRLNERLRSAFLEGAEEDSRRRLGRGLMAEELEPVSHPVVGTVSDAGR